ncbi:MAG: hypothetical protein IID40_03605 [Planctomycetes bacterium]|nr:hypothetical protein [Planctomycetota bacterium]
MNDTSTKRAIGCVLLTALVGVGYGCVKRSETIRVEPDGTMHLLVEFEGDLEDVRQGGAMLNDPGPWTVEDQVVTKKDGNQEMHRRATLVLPPGTEVPTDYAGKDETLSEVALKFLTSLDIEQRPDGTYYHFKRVYRRRDSARIAYFRHKLVDESLEKLEDRKIEDLNPDEREQIARVLVEFEMIKTVVLAEAAADSMEPALRQDDWLAMHQVIQDVFRQVGSDRVIELLLMEGDEAEDQIELEVEKINAQIEVGINRILTERDPDGGLVQTFQAAVDRQRRLQAITEDLQDESFEVRLQLPGRIVGHNSLIGIRDDGQVEWEFDGQALNDRDQVLLATSVVERR